MRALRLLVATGLLVCLQLPTSAQKAPSRPSPPPASPNPDPLRVEMEVVYRQMDNAWVTNRPAELLRYLQRVAHEDFYSVNGEEDLIKVQHVQYLERRVRYGGRCFPGAVRGVRTTIQQLAEKQGVVTATVLFKAVYTVTDRNGGHGPINKTYPYTEWITFVDTWFKVDGEWKWTSNKLINQRSQLGEWVHSGAQRNGLDSLHAVNRRTCAWSFY